MGPVEKSLCGEELAAWGSSGPYQQAVSASVSLSAKWVEFYSSQGEMR